MGNNTTAEKKVHNERAVAASKPVGDKKLDKDLDRVRTEMIQNYAHDADEADRALIENLSSKIRFDDYRNTYIEGECLGEGDFGAVYRCTSKSDGQDYAVKIMKKVVALANDRDTVREINLMLHADHPNLVQIKEVYHVDRKPLVLVMDLVEPGTDKHGMVMEIPDLMTILMEGPLNMTETAKVVYQTAAAIDFLNTRCNAMHRDLKPDNILIGPEMFQRIRVTDYCQGRIFSDMPPPGTSASLLDVGHDGYSAPETISSGRQHVGLHGLKMDVWSLGVITYMCASGSPPFPLNSGKSRALTLKGQFKSMTGPKWRGVDAGCKELIAHMLTVEPDRRISMGEIMAHPWVRSNAH